MTPLTGVLDANAIIGLAQGGVFDRLEALYARLYVPPAVIREVTGEGQGLAGDEELRGALGIWVTEAAPDPARSAQFMGLRSAADREVLALAQERGVEHVLTSDGQLAGHARRHGLACLPTAMVVVLLKDRGLIGEVKPKN